MQEYTLHTANRRPRHQPPRSVELRSKHFGFEEIGERTEKGGIADSYLDLCMRISVWRHNNEAKRTKFAAVQVVASCIWLFQFPQCTWNLETQKLKKGNTPNLCGLHHEHDIFDTKPCIKAIGDLLEQVRARLYQMHVGDFVLLRIFLKASVHRTPRDKSEKITAPQSLLSCTSWSNLACVKVDQTFGVTVASLCLIARWVAQTNSRGFCNYSAIADSRDYSSWKFPFHSNCTVIAVMRRVAKTSDPIVRRIAISR